MNTIANIIKKSNWTYHVNGGYWTQEVLDSDVFEKANAELEAFRNVVEVMREVKELTEPYYTIEYSRTKLMGAMNMIRGALQIYDEVLK